MVNQNLEHNVHWGVTPMKVKKGRNRIFAGDTFRPQRDCILVKGKRVGKNNIGKCNVDLMKS